MTFSCNCLPTVIQLEAFTPGYFVYICGFLFFLFVFLLPTAEELLGSYSKALQQRWPFCLFLSVRIQHCFTMGTMSWVTHSLVLFAHLWGHFSVILNWQTVWMKAPQMGLLTKGQQTFTEAAAPCLAKRAGDDIRGKHSNSLFTRFILGLDYV